MSKAKPIIEFLIGLILFIATTWVLTELITFIFKIEDGSTKRYIRWAITVLLLISGSLVRIFYPSLDKKNI